MGLGIWILRNKAKYPPMPYIAILVFPMLFAFSVLIALFFLFLISFIFKIENEIIPFYYIILLVTIYLKREYYKRLLYNIFLFLLRRNGKTQFEWFLIRLLKYCFMTFIYLPLLLLLLQAFLLNDKKDTFLWVTLPFMQPYITLLITILITIVVEHSIPKKLLAEVEEIYTTPR